MHSVLIINSVLNVKALVGAFNQEALDGGFFVIVKTDGSFAALVGRGQEILRYNSFPLSTAQQQMKKPGF